MCLGSKDAERSSQTWWTLLKTPTKKAAWKTDETKRGSMQLKHQQGHCAICWAACRPLSMSPFVAMMSCYTGWSGLWWCSCFSVISASYIPIKISRKTYHFTVLDFWDSHILVFHWFPMRNIHWFTSPKETWNIRESCLLFDTICRLLLL